VSKSHILMKWHNSCRVIKQLDKFISWHYIITRQIHFVHGWYTIWPLSLLIRQTTWSIFFLRQQAMAQLLNVCWENPNCSVPILFWFTKTIKELKVRRLLTKQQFNLMFDTFISRHKHLPGTLKTLWDLLSCTIIVRLLLYCYCTILLHSYC